MSYRRDRLKRSGPPLSSRGMIASKVVLTNQPLDRARKKRRFLDSISVESEDILVVTPGFSDDTKILKVGNDNIKIMPSLSISIMKDLDSVIVFFRYQISASNIIFLKLKCISMKVKYICNVYLFKHWPT